MISWTTLTLRIGSDQLSVEQVEKAFGIAPTRIVRRGDPVSLRNPTGPKHQSSLWLYESPIGESASPEEHLDWLIRLIEKNLSKVEALSASCSFDAWIGIGSGNQGGFSLSHHHLVRLAAVPIDLVFDLYPSADDDDPVSSDD